MASEESLNLIKRLKALADIGLLYSINEYDRERYTEIHEIAIGLLQQLTGSEIDMLQSLFLENKEYPTAKVDVRALIIQDEKILFVQEVADNKWSLPGGWADIGYSASEVVIKECLEETGLTVLPVRLLAVFDKKFHAHPPQPFYVYKMVFQCNAVAGQLIKGFDVADAQYFDADKIPPLSEDRILKSQVELLFNLASTPGSETYFD